MKPRFSKRHTLPFVMIAILVLTGTQAWAAQSVYVWIVGAVQDEIHGDSTVISLDRENHIEALDYHHLMEIPPGSSLIDHQTVIITKRFDRSGPQLLMAMDTNERLDVIFRFFRPEPGGSGAEEEYQQITLTDARIVSIEPLSPDVLNAETAARPATERIRFSYGTLTSEYLSIGSSSYTVTVPVE